MKRWIGCLGVAALLTAGCGGDDSADNNTDGDENTATASVEDGAEVTQVTFNVPGMT